MERIPKAESISSAEAARQEQSPVSKPESHEVSSERLSALRETVHSSFAIISGLSGFKETAPYAPWTIEAASSPKKAAEEKKEVAIREEFLERAVDASEKLMQKIRLSVMALFIAFGAPNAMKAPDIEEGAYADRVTAAMELERDGVTKDQRVAHINGLSDALATGLHPFSYGDEWKKGEGHSISNLVRVAKGVVEGVATSPNLKRETDLADLTRLNESEGDHELVKMHQDELRAFQGRMDAWRMYLGLSQRNGTFGISDYHPQNSKEDRYYYKISNFKDSLEAPVIVGSKYPKTVLQKVVEKIQQEQLESGSKFTIEKDSYFGVMGNFKMSLGEDEKGSYVSYYDRWDLKGSLEGKDGIIGKPFEIYDRIYYDPITYKVLQPIVN